MTASRDPAALTAAAVVVTHGVTGFLAETLTALAAQDRAPESVLVVDVAGTPDAVTDAVVDAWPEGRRPTVVDAPGARTFGEAVRRALAAVDLDAGWLWLLHDDSAPRPEALGRLLRAVEIAPSVAVAGCKQVDWDDPARLIQVGLSTSRFGRRMTGLDDHEVDQGQHDGREDVLAVGLAGALVRRDVWDVLGGPDRALGPYGDGLDLCRRARLAGHRVVVVPRAEVRHAQASLRGAAVRPGWDARRSVQARREAFLHQQLVGVPALLVPVVALLALGSSLVRAGMRLTTKEPHLVLAELLAPWVVLARPGRVLVARRRAARVAVQRRSALRPLQRDTRSVLRQVRDRRLAAAEARRTRNAPSELELRELAALRTRRRAGLAVVVLAGIALTVLTVGSAIGAVLSGARLSGGTLAFGDAGPGEVWSAIGSWWVQADLGHPAAPDPLLTVLAPATALLGTIGGASALVVLGAWVLAGVGAWFAAGAATRSVVVRLWAAATWTAAPALLVGLDQVRLGGLLTHVALPWVLLGVARAVGVARVDAVASGLVGAQHVSRDDTDGGADDEPRTGDAPDEAAETAETALVQAGPRSDGTAERPAPQPVETAEPSFAAAAGAGLAACVATAGTPALLPVLLVALVAVAVLRPRRRLWWVAVPPLVLSGPLLVWVAVDPQRWRALVAAPGLAVPAAPAVAWQQALGWPVPVDTVPLWVALLPGAVLAVVAVLSLAIRPPAVRAVRLGWLVAALGLATAIGLGHLGVVLGDGLLGPTWTGGAVSTVLAGLLVAALVGVGRLRQALTRVAFGWRHVGAGLLAALALAAPVALLGTWVVRASHPSALEVSDTAVVPAVGLQLQASDDAARVLELVPSGSELHVTLLRGDGVQLIDTSRAVTGTAVTGDPLAPEPAAPDDAETELADAAAGLTVGAQGVADQLADLAVGAVLVPPSQDPARAELVGLLDATDGLERVTETEAGVIWRVASDDRTVAWARVVRGSAEQFGEVLEPVASSDGRIATELDAGPSDRLLVLAERADPGWHAWLDGVPLRSVETGWRQAFELGGDSGRLVVRHEETGQHVWLLVQLVVLGATVLLAVPTRRRRTR
ncbi:glycosyltransferase [Actinotalea sp. M2MS4P-6]|uniref:glycosyltransferase n=1 Tax=Actinotalea sp. M2MS4P-6 TaxID=2983762 RepID=UPI0021E3BA6A|nr:glycosyltransferase [Actinotalea sp. M2MS4P-6]MCV2394162.1 glycosyltransferase [Actinotalea sp. M2MS4P-6]